MKRLKQERHRLRKGLKNSPTVVERWQLKIIPPIAAFFLWLLEKTVSLRVLKERSFEEICGAESPLIYACWHNCLLFLVYIRRQGESAILISQSRDGELIARTAKRLGFRPVRGSSSRGSLSAFRQLLKEAGRGSNIAITPDGPRGPVCKVQDGIIHLARKTGMAIAPFAYSARWKLVLPSWDGLVVPAPFGRAVLIYGLPVKVGPWDDTKEKREELERELMRITRQAESYF